MTLLSKVFFGYMVLAGAAMGVFLVLYPEAGEFWLKPYFWVLIAVALFDLGVFAVYRITPAIVLSMNVRIAGFVIGILLIGMIPILAGSPAKFF